MQILLLIKVLLVIFFNPLNAVIVVHTFEMTKTTDHSPLTPGTNLAGLTPWNGLAFGGV